MNNVQTPLEIIEEILQNLPIKSVIRFKRVCKAWSSLISDRTFKKRHQSKHTSHKILISSPSGSRSLDCKKGSIRQLKCPPLVKIVGSSNGLVCVALDKCRDFAMWNPTTDDFSWTLPNPELIPLDDSFIYGFGYDSSTDDYKIVVIADCRVSLDIPRIAIQVFSLRKNSWKTNPDLVDGLAPNFHKHYHGAVTYNGVLHWRLSNEQLLGFDLQKEEAIALALPQRLHHLRKSSRIGVIDGSLCLLIPRFGNELWVMKEYRNSDSWKKLFSIRSVFPRKSWEMFSLRHKLLPLCKTDDMEVLLLRDGIELIKVCCKVNTFQKLEVDIEHGGDGLGKSEAVVYEENLESPLDYI